VPLTPQIAMPRLTAADRDWIRRQGITARALAEERRLVRERLSAADNQLARVREPLRRPPGRFTADRALGCARGTDQLRIGSGRSPRPRRFATRAGRTAMR
jgi:hypothetical protein